MPKYIEERERPHKKRGKKKNAKKCDHKHVYVESQMAWDSRDFKTPIIGIGEYCKICGRVKDFKWNWHLDMNVREELAKHPNTVYTYEGNPVPIVREED